MKIFLKFPHRIAVLAALVALGSLLYEKALRPTGSVGATEIPAPAPGRHLLHVTLLYRADAKPTLVIRYAIRPPRAKGGDRSRTTATSHPMQG